MTLGPIQPFDRGQDLRNLTPRLEQLRTRLNMISPLSGGRVGIDQTPAGTVIAQQPRFTPSLIRDVLSVFGAIITGNEDFVGSPAYRWKYAWSEAEFAADSVAIATPANAYRSGTTATDYALNLCEVFNTTRFQGGVDTDATDYTNTGFELRPIGGAGDDNTHKYDVPVWMYEVVNADGLVQFWFDKPNTHDGPCS